MRPTVKYLSSACAGALLFACADTGPRSALPAPPAQLAGSPDDAYVLGRQQHLANRHPAAIASYHAALRLAPRHVNATNGLATLYAEQGNFPKAIALWRELTDSPSAPSGPGAAFLYSNLGYAHLLGGDYQQAIVVLERACVLDPLNYRAWRHLGSALEKLGQAERAQLMFKQASTLEQHDFKADYALVKRSAPAAAEVGAGAGAVDLAAATATEGWAATEVRQGANGMFELRRAPAAVMPAPAAAVMPAPVAAVIPAPTPDPLEQDTPEPEPALASATVATVAAAADDQVTRLEIRNGNGVTGMARSLARKMSDTSLRVVRLSNEKGFNVEHTRIEYQGGFREAATRLAERFGNATITEVESCNNADMRLVIGRDLVRSKAEARRIIKAALVRAAKAG
jgi:tetratricopeptide (TPR) repeat protein